MTPMAGAEDRVLGFAVLVYRTQFGRGETVWLARSVRSVLTSDVATGSTADEAVETLKEGIAAGIRSAQARGKNAAEWYREQVRARQSLRTPTAAGCGA